MTRKAVIALAAVLALGSLPLASEAFARGGGHGHGGGHGGGRGGGHAFHGAPHIGHIGRRAPGFAVHHGASHGHRFFVRGHNHHFWHGRWWDYGVGPCWVWSDQYQEFVWVCSPY
jgi:hypothetical protein